MTKLHVWLDNILIIIILISKLSNYILELHKVMFSSYWNNYIDPKILGTLWICLLNRFALKVLQFNFFFNFKNSFYEFNIEYSLEIVFVNTHQGLTNNYLVMKYIIYILLLRFTRKSNRNSISGTKFFLLYVLSKSNWKDILYSKKRLPYSVINSIKLFLMTS